MVGRKEGGEDGRKGGREGAKQGERGGEGERSGGGVAADVGEGAIRGLESKDGTGRKRSAKEPLLRTQRQGL